MPRLSKEKWLDEGFRLLSNFAQDKLRIQYLCQRLGVTKGSFYHHFKSMDHYISALLERWEEENTHTFIKVANQGKDAEERMEALSERAVVTDQSIEAAIRSWAFYKPVVKKHLKKVDRIRLKYLEAIFEENGDDPETAAAKANLDYAVLIGIQQLFPNINSAEMEQLRKHYRGYL